MDFKENRIKQENRTQELVLQILVVCEKQTATRLTNAASTSM